MNNPSLHQEPRYEPAAVIPLKQEASLIDWLKANNRLIPRDSAEVVFDAAEDDGLEDFIDTEGDYEDDFDDDSDDEVEP